MYRYLVGLLGLFNVLGVNAQNSVVMNQVILDSLTTKSSSSIGVVSDKNTSSQASVEVGVIEQPHLLANLDASSRSHHEVLVKNETQPVARYGEINSGSYGSWDLNNEPVVSKTNIVEPDYVRSGNYALNSKTGEVEFALHQGLLKPQLIELLLHHSHISNTDSIQWTVSDNYAWPNRFIVRGPSIDHVINRVLAPYQLLAEFTANGNVVIQKLQ